MNTIHCTRILSSYLQHNNPCETIRELSSRELTPDVFYSDSNCNKERLHPNRVGAYSGSIFIFYSTFSVLCSTCNYFYPNRGRGVYSGLIFNFYSRTVCTSTYEPYLVSVQVKQVLFSPSREWVYSGSIYHFYKLTAHVLLRRMYLPGTSIDTTSLS